MQVRFVDKTGFLICGYSVETSLEESGHDVAALYTDYFSSGKATAIHNAAKSKAAEYYGLMWYLEGHERYRKRATSRIMSMVFSSHEDYPHFLYNLYRYSRLFIWLIIGSCLLVILKKVCCE